MNRVSVIILVVVFSFFASCNFGFGEWHYEEIKRVKSPDGLIDAIFVRGNGGATTGFSYSVFLAPSGIAFDEKLPLFAQDNAVFKMSRSIKEIELVWRKANFLEIRFEKANVYHFQNIWRFISENSVSYAVELKLVMLNDNSSLPSY